MHHNYIDVNRHFYDNAATSYDARGRVLEPGADTPEFLAATVLDNLSAHPAESRILEIGPGAGYVLEALCSSGARCEAVELSPAMASLSSRRAPGATIHVGNVLDFDFPASSFDGIMANAVLHLFPYSDAMGLLAV